MANLASGRRMCLRHKGFTLKGGLGRGQLKDDSQPRFIGVADYTDEIRNTKARNKEKFLYHIFKKEKGPLSF